MPSLHIPRDERWSPFWCAGAIVTISAIWWFGFYQLVRWIVELFS